jgi:hypothetical protein
VAGSPCVEHRFPEDPTSSQYIWQTFLMPSLLMEFRCPHCSWNIEILLRLGPQLSAILRPPCYRENDHTNLGIISDLLSTTHSTSYLHITKLSEDVFVSYSRFIFTSHLSTYFSSVYVLVYFSSPMVGVTLGSIYMFFHLISNIDTAQ